MLDHIKGIPHNRRLSIQWGALSLFVFVIYPLLLWYFPRQPVVTPQPLGEYPTQTIKGATTVDGMPAVYEGGVITIVAVKCNVTRQRVPVEGVSWWFNRDTGMKVPYRSGSGVREPGCVPQTFDNPLTRDVKPGVWRLEGKETAGEQVKAWASEWFVVMPSP